MFDDLAAYFVENVVAAYDEYTRARDAQSAGRSNDLRLAINAAMALYHLRERLPTSCARSRADLGRKCADYELLGDVVNAAKHDKLDDRKANLIRSAADIVEEIVITEYADSDGPYRDYRKAIALQLVDGSRRELYDVLTSVLNLWIDELEGCNIIAPMQRFGGDRNAIPPKRTEVRTPVLDLEAMQGVRFRVTFSLRRYNYTTGVVEPVDLTGHSAQMRIFKVD